MTRGSRGVGQRADCRGIPIQIEGRIAGHDDLRARRQGHGEPYDRHPQPLGHALRAARWFLGDSHHIRQIVLNLLSNAVKFTERGTVSIRASIADKDSRLARIRVEVRDTGIGIPQESLPRLFERFYRAPNTENSKAKGIGLGLYIVQEIVAAHGGKLAVESALGRGTTFTLTLPLFPLPPGEG